MSDTKPGADELRVRARLRQLVDGPSAEPPPMPPGPPPDGYQERPRDWLDDIADIRFASEDQPEPAPTETPASKDAGPEAKPWWSVGKDPTPPHAPPPPPAVHVTVNQPQPPAPPTPTSSPRRARARRWFLVHGAAAFTGWTFGLYHSMAAFLDTLGPGAPAAGLALAGGSWVAAALVVERIVSRYVPSEELRRAAAWACRIPFATALLATALHAPNALI